MNVKLKDQDIRWIKQALQKEYAYYLKTYGNEQYNRYTDQIFKLYCNFHNLTQDIKIKEQR
tara:strand:+ start:991 stop:1173 length:183 start_codon:yes stop_codon:yes gene_type:complete